jgi:hypothetical protein
VCTSPEPATVADSAPGDPLGVPDNVVERCGAGPRHRPEQLRVDRCQPAGLVRGWDCCRSWRSSASRLYRPRDRSRGAPPFRLRDERDRGAPGTSAVFQLERTVADPEVVACTYSPGAMSRGRIRSPGRSNARAPCAGNRAQGEPCDRPCLGARESPARRDEYRARGRQHPTSLTNGTSSAVSSTTATRSTATGSRGALLRLTRCVCRPDLLHHGPCSFRRAPRTRCTGSSPPPPGRGGRRRPDAPARGRRPDRRPR